MRIRGFIIKISGGCEEDGVGTQNVFFKSDFYILNNY